MVVECVLAACLLQLEASLPRSAILSALNDMNYVDTTFKHCVFCQRVSRHIDMNEISQIFVVPGGNPPFIIS